MKKLVFIGNRLNAFYIIVERKLSFESLDVWVLKDSPLHKVINSYISSYNVFTDDTASKKALVSHLHSSDYDLLITNGCPFKLPVSALAAQKSGRLHINIHPTYLPELKGKTPLNGVIYLQYDFIGATVHYMTDDIDAGDIICQEKIQLTEEIDLGLIYFMSFSLEGEVFRKALDLLEENDFEVRGTKQVGAGSTFNRSPELFFPDFKQDKTDLIIRKVISKS